MPPAASAPFPEDPKLGSTVLICADDYRREAIGGQLVYLDAEEIVILRSDSRVGEVCVHFPQSDYDLHTTEA